MKQRYKDGDTTVKPNGVTYTTLIFMWTDRPGQECKEMVASLMQEMGEWCGEDATGERIEDPTEDVSFSTTRSQ